ncbi:MAG: D-alanyl-D-alanine carboxypeptidase [Nitrospiraceae bacterium]|nr:MAG: D-alanyl-D-alanine carboxypeptidase [Nitrospiraceae bacterium]
MKKSLLYLLTTIIIIPFVFTICNANSAQKSGVPLQKKQLTGKTSSSRKSRPARHVLQPLSKNPYLGAIVIDAATNKVLFEDNPDVKGYPASVVKLMNFLLILEALEAKEISLQDKIAISAEAAKIGGSQVYLKENEVHTVDNLLYALMVQSANDAAAALAIHYKGSKEEFVKLMNKRAGELGMNDTSFHSVHGLPPAKGQLPDVSTPRDLTKLSREVLKHPQALQYTSTKQRIFRKGEQPFIIRNHNHLVGSFKGCDGLKTGYFRAAGFSIAATAAKNGNRAIAVILGSVDRKVRDAKARKLLSQSLLKMEAGLSSAHAFTGKGNTGHIDE